MGAYQAIIGSGGWLVGRATNHHEHNTHKRTKHGQFQPQYLPLSITDFESNRLLIGQSYWNVKQQIYERWR